MEYINFHIKKEINKHSSSKLLLSKEEEEKKQKKEDFNIWLENIRISMHLCKYRQVINEIESKKYNFHSIPEEHWKYQSIEIDAIFKILKKKFINHPKEIMKENSHQNHSCMFWLNQIYLILEQLILQFRPDLNKNLNYNDESILKPIHCIIEGHIKLIFCLIIFAQYNHQIHEICSYLSIIDRFTPYIKFANDSNSYIYFQKVQLLKAKLFIENCDYINAMESVYKNIDFCFNCIKLLGDEDHNIYYLENFGEKTKKNTDRLNNEIIYNNTNSINSKKNIKRTDSNLRISTNSRASIKNNNTKKENYSNKKENKLQKKTSKNKESKKKLIQIKNINLNNIKKEPETDKIDIFLTEIKKRKRMNPHIKKSVEEIIENISLNFYLRGVIFENLGDIDSALDSYKEVEWFSMKFLQKKSPFFAKYMSSLLRCAWNNFNLITKLKEEKEKRKNLNNFLKSIDEAKKNSKIKAIKNKNSFSNIKLSNKRYDKKLRNLINNIGKELYKEEEIKNYYLYNKFTKTGYILSTVKMIDNLLSKDFKDVLKKMEKIEITKQKEEIKDLINKTIIKRRQKSMDEQNLNIKKESLTPFNINTRKEKKQINNKFNNDIPKKNNFKKINFIEHNKVARTIDMNHKNFSHFAEYSNRRYSISLKKLKKFLDLSKKNKTINLSKDIENNIDKNNIDIENLFHKKYFNKYFFNLKKYKINRIKTGLTSSRSTDSKDKVQRFPLDKENFNKEFIQKKYFLDKYCNKELNFQKRLLKTKSYNSELAKVTEDFDLNKIIKDAELNFKIKYEIEKSGKGKNNLNNLIKHNFNIVNKKLSSEKVKEKRPSTPIFIRDKKENKDIFPDISTNNMNLINEMKMKQLTLDYSKLLKKTNEIIQKRKDIILGNTSHINK